MLIVAYVIIDRLNEAVAVAKEKGAVLNSQAVIAQALHESLMPGGMHMSTLAESYNNLFGIKDDGHAVGRGYHIARFVTHEYENGQLVQIVSDFVAYPSWNECLVDYSRIIGEVYPEARAHADKPAGDGSVAGWIGALEEPSHLHWATDPNYVAEVLAIAEELA